MIKHLIVVLALAFSTGALAQATPLPGTMKPLEHQLAPKQPAQILWTTNAPTKTLMSWSNAAEILTINCQRGHVKFNMKTGATTYKDCTPDEGGRVLFEAFAREIFQASVRR